MSKQKKSRTSTDHEEELINNFYKKLKKSGLTKNEVETKKIVKFMINELRDVPVNIRYFYLETLAIEKNIFEIISPELFIRIIRHLRLLGEQKRESHAICANIIIFIDDSSASRGGKVSAIPYNDKKIQLPQEIDINEFFKPNNVLEQAYRYVNVNNSFFAYQYSKDSDKTKFIGIRDFSSHDELIKNMLKTCVGNTVGFSLEDDKSCIRIYHGGNHIVDYGLSEATGSWRARFTSHIYKLIKKINLQDEDAKLLTNLIIQLAYTANGALLVITNDIGKFSDASTGLDVNITFGEEAMKHNFVSYASIDGAVIIEHKKGLHAQIKKCGVILSPTQPPSKLYSNLINITNSGSRHEKAACHACENPEDYVVVISENKTISFLHSEEVVYWRDKDIDSKEFYNKITGESKC